MERKDNSIANGKGSKLFSKKGHLIFIANFKKSTDFTLKKDLYL